MANPTKALFISYRRSDSSDVTGRICDSLKAKFGEDSVFKDVDSIPLGADFRKIISEAVGQCHVLLAIIGDDWLNVMDGQGKRRIDDPNDFVQIEIAAALQRSIPVVPVLVEKTPMPRADELPPPLHELAFRNGIPVRPDPDFHNDMDRLCQQVAGYIAPRKVSHGIIYGVVATLLIVAVAIIGSKMLGSSRDTTIKTAATSKTAPASETVPANNSVNPAGDVPDLNGSWRTDAEAERTYVFEQNGREIAITLRWNNKPFGTGHGRIDGDTLTYNTTWRDSKSEYSANCEMKATNRQYREFVGKCTRTGQQPFQWSIRR